MNDWPPKSWETLRVEALIARELRLGMLLVELDELGELVADDAILAAEVRVLSARCRTLRNDWRDLVRALSTQLEEVES